MTRDVVRDMMIAVVRAAVTYNQATLGSERLYLYINKLQQRVEACVDTYLQTLLGKSQSISKEEFLHAVANDAEVTRMFMARFVRHDLELTKFVPKRFDTTAAFAAFSVN
jgi:hypothetical protein